MIKDVASIVNATIKVKNKLYLKQHQQGKTEYFTFFKYCAETGIEKWIIRLNEMTCTYYDLMGKEIFAEIILTS